MSSLREAFTVEGAESAEEEMKRWEVQFTGPSVIVEAETREEAIGAAKDTVRLLPLVVESAEVAPDAVPSGSAGNGTVSGRR